MESEFVDWVLDSAVQRASMSWCGAYRDMVFDTDARFRDAPVALHASNATRSRELESLLYIG